MAALDGVIPAIIGAANAAGGDFQIERSLRFNSADTAHLSRTFSTFTDINVGTISFWLKRSAEGSSVIAAGWAGGVSYSGSIQFNSSDNALQVSVGGSSAHTFKTNAILRDFSAWYHVVAAWDRSASAADKVKVWINGVAQTSSDTGYQSWTSGDCQIWAANSGNRIGRGDADRYNNLLNGYLAEYHYIDGQALDETDFGEYDDNNVWQPKEYSGTYGSNGFYLKFADNSSDAALGTDSSGNGNTWTVNNIEASGAFGIGTACSILTTSQTITFPITYATTVTYEFFTRVTNAATYTYFAHETSTADKWNIGINASGDLLFGNYNGGWTTFSTTGLGDGNWHFVRLTTTGSSTSLYIDGTLFGTNASGGSVSTGSQVTNRLDGGAFRIAYLRITNGGTPPTTGIPALADMNQPAGSGGTLAFFDKLDDIASSGTKTSDGGGVTITMSAATVATDTSGTDSLIDSPTNYTADSGNNGGNYCTLSPFVNPSSGQTLKNGNLTCSGVTGRVAGTVYANTGKVYWEFVAGTDYTMAGIESSTCLWGATYPGENDQQYALYGNAGSGQLYHNGGTTSVDGFVSGDVIGVALDLDGGNLYFYKNGAAMNSGSAVATGLTGSWTANCRSGSGGYDGDTKFNFGQRPFAYTPPTGYVSLCTTNLADPTISDGTTAMSPVLWTGNGGSQTISGLNFAPSFIWHKIRSITGGHQLYDIVRGVSNRLRSDDTGAETTLNGVTAFNSDGWTMTAGNNSGETYVSWTWDAGTTTSTNNDGSTQSSVRVSTTNGFSIGTWTGNGAITTVGHGLGAVPGMAIIKKRNGTSPWYVWHQDLGGSGWNLQLNNNNARTNNSDVFSQGGLFNSSTIPLGAVGNVSGNNVFLAWSAVEGYSAFGQYTGNGSSDGPFVYTGFRVAWLMIKNRQTGNETWTIHDSTRDVDNPAEHRLLPSSEDAESTGTSARYKDLLSNGFKIRGTSGEQNTSGEIYIYAAFAENPFKTARAR